MQTRFLLVTSKYRIFRDDALAYFLIYYITNTISDLDIRCLLMTSDSKDGKKKQESHFDWKKLLPAPLLGFIVSVVFLINQYSTTKFLYLVHWDISEG